MLFDTFFLCGFLFLSYNQLVSCYQNSADTMGDLQIVRGIKKLSNQKWGKMGKHPTNNSRSGIPNGIEPIIGILVVNLKRWWKVIKKRETFVQEVDATTAGRMVTWRKIAGSTKGLQREKCYYFQFKKAGWEWMRNWNILCHRRGGISIHINNYRSRSGLGLWLW